MARKPKNCICWGERNDTDRFYKCMDLFLFTSRGNPGNKETMPLVLREAIGWHIPIALYNLDVYYFEPELFELAYNIWGKLYISKIDNIKSTIVVDNN
jgi:hypothetical protein